MEKREANRMEITRREFLKSCAIAATLATAGLTPTVTAGLTSTASPEPVTWTRTVCRYCSVGCGIMVGVTNGKVVAAKGDIDNPINKGLLCTKGFTLPYILYAEDRLTKPLIRKNGKFVEASWDEAMSLIVSKYKEVIANDGPEAVAYYGSGQLQVEESYLMNKIFKAGLRSNNVEGNPRLCMASAVAGYVTTYGADEPLGTLDDIEKADLFFIIGNNTVEAHPIVFLRVAKRVAENPNVKVILGDYRKTLTNRIADLRLSFWPGQDLALLNAMTYVCIKEGYADEGMLKHLVFFDNEGKEVDYEAYKKFLEDYTPEKAAPICRIPVDDIYKAARMFGEAKNVMSMWCMGFNQRIVGTAVNNLIHNLHLITGKVGRPGSDSFSLTGQPNATGGIRQTGALSHLLPAHRLIARKAHREHMEDFWGVPRGTIAPKPGLHTIAMFSALAEGKVKCIWIACANPGQTLPNLNKYRPAMERAFTVVSEAYHPTRISELATVVLPSAMWCEKTGVYGNTERRLQFMPKIVEPPAGAETDTLAFMDFAKRMGLGHLVDHFSAATGAETANKIWDEWRHATVGTYVNLYGMTYERLAKISGGLRWPCPAEDHPGTRRRFVSGFNDPFARPAPGETIDFYARPDHKAVIWLRPQYGPYEPADAEYPFYMNSGRVQEHWHSGTMTMKVPALMRAVPEAYVEINPKDAAKLGVSSGELVRLTSRRGTAVLKARVVDIPMEGTVFVPFFDPDKLVNLLTVDAHCPISKQPEFKIGAVKIAKV